MPVIDEERVCWICGTKYQPWAGNQLTCRNPTCRRLAQSHRFSIWYETNRARHIANVTARKKRPLCLL